MAFVSEWCLVGSAHTVVPANGAPARLSVARTRRFSVSKIHPMAPQNRIDAMDFLAEFREGLQARLSEFMA